MDSITQIALGAAVGEACLGKNTGNKALLWGALIGTLPDLDVIPGNLFFDEAGQMAFHRGVSHSLLLFLILSPLIGNFLYKRYNQHGVTLKKAIVSVFAILFTHALLDCFTTWGTQLFWPLDYRVEFHSIFVVDPVYTLPLLIGCIGALCCTRNYEYRRYWNNAGILISSCYLVLTLFNQSWMSSRFEYSLNKQNINYNRYRTQPTALNNVLWTCIAETNSGFYIGYHSWYDNPAAPISWSYYHKRRGLLKEYRGNEKVKTLINTSKGYHLVEYHDNGIIFHDLRFGQIVNWKANKKAFAFSFLLQKTNNTVKVKRYENSMDINGALLNSLWKRIWGGNY